MSETPTTAQLPGSLDINNLGAEPVHADDPRWDYDLSPQQASRAWPCGTCSVRRDEHADQAIPHAFSDLDITSHRFTIRSEPTAPRP